ncbi:MAG: hypothetical protein IT385_18545 [Deltaproteobacteria bacterium]|nr:hypothetical protein [Deltaproteobacteria bacterium]
MKTRMLTGSLSLALALAVTTLGTSTTSAEPIRSPGRFGLGIGSATLSNGLSAKYFMSKQHALQFNLGVFGGGGAEHRWSRFGGLGLGVDYLFEMPDIVRAGEAFDLAWNLGAGVGLGFDDDANDDWDTALGVSFILGLEFNFIPIPIDLVIEWRPGLLLVPDTDFDAVDFTAHLRFYF